MRFSVKAVPADKLEDFLNNSFRSGEQLKEILPYKIEKDDLDMVSVYLVIHLVTDPTGS
jgi:hypothetical protein